MGWWVFTLIAICVFTHIIFSAQWQEKYILIPWREEFQALQEWHNWLSRQTHHLQQIPLLDNRPGLPGQTDKEFKLARNAAAQCLIDFQRIPLIAPPHTSSHAFYAWEHIVHFIRWRWHSQQEAQCLKKAEDLLVQAKMLHRRLRRIQSKYRQRSTAIIEFLGKFSPTDPSTRSLYPLMVDIAQIARQDAGDLYGFGLGRSHVLLALLDLGQDVMNLTSEGSALTCQIELDLLSPKLTTAVENINTLFHTIPPLPKTASELNLLEAKIHQISHKIEQTKRHLAHLRTQKKHLESAIKWLRDIDNISNVQYRICRSSHQYREICINSWGPISKHHPWWQEALAHGIPWKLCNDLYKMAAKLQYAVRSQLKESDIPSFLNRVHELQSLVPKISLGYQHLQKTHQQYMQQKQILSERVGEQLPQQIKHLALWLSEVNAPTKFWQEHKQHEAKLKVLQHESRLSFSPSDYESIMEQAEILAQSIRQTKIDSQKQLQEIKKRLRVSIIELDKLERAIIHEILKYPPIPRSCCQIELIIINNKQVDTWQLSDNFSQLYNYERQISSFLSQAQNSWTTIQNFRQEWGILKKEITNTQHQLKALYDTIAKYRKTARWELVLDDYDDLLAEVITLQQNLLSWKQRPDDKNWLPNLINEVKMANRLAKQKIPLMREQLRKLILQEDTYTNKVLGQN